MKNRLFVTASAWETNFTLWRYITLASTCPNHHFQDSKFQDRLLAQLSSTYLLHDPRTGDTIQTGNDAFFKLSDINWGPLTIAVVSACFIWLIRRPPKPVLYRFKMTFGSSWWASCVSATRTVFTVPSWRSIFLESLSTRHFMYAWSTFRPKLSLSGLLCT